MGKNSFFFPLDLADVCRLTSLPRPSTTSVHVICLCWLHTGMFGVQTIVLQLTTVIWFTWVCPTSCTIMENMWRWQTATFSNMGGFSSSGLSLFADAQWGGWTNNIRPPMKFLGGDTLPVVQLIYSHCMLYNIYQHLDTLQASANRIYQKIFRICVKFHVCAWNCVIK